MHSRLQSRWVERGWRDRHLVNGDIVSNAVFHDSDSCVFNFLEFVYLSGILSQFSLWFIRRSFRRGLPQGGGLIHEDVTADLKLRSAPYSFVLILLRFRLLFGGAVRSAVDIRLRSLHDFKSGFFIRHVVWFREGISSCTMISGRALVSKRLKGV